MTDYRQISLVGSIVTEMAACGCVKDITCPEQGFYFEVQFPAAK